MIDNGAHGLTHDDLAKTCANHAWRLLDKTSVSMPRTTYFEHCVEHPRTKNDLYGRVFVLHHCKLQTTERHQNQNHGFSVASFRRALSNHHIQPSVPPSLATCLVKQAPHSKNIMHCELSFRMPRKERISQFHAHAAPRFSFHILPLPRHWTSLP